MIRWALAVLVRAADLLWRHAAAEGNGEVEGRFSLDMVVGEGTRGGEVLPGVHEAEICLRARCPDREKSGEISDGEVLGYGHGDGWSGGQ
jgi:hypothetical protein